ncbi:hypothetical protein EXIGLDRAFT_828690 [Exidia glandulosa HHB12029]|uniref:MYND-type domain-containing protein n=1 Tax=Exidia glandulosa HHB12029 TaxID=1314781 RepID=A0A165QAS4_EXIGL|nr:hypothetical protein EXIGLDRAFT_828690 [Exidia glandulosa HHB12029]
MSSDPVDNFAEGLLRDLRDPYHPTFCLDCITRSMDALFRDETRQSAIALALQRKHHGLLTSIMSYFTAPRDEAGMTALDALLEWNLSMCERRASHRAWDFSTVRVSDAALQTLSQPVRVCLRLSSKLVRKQLFSRRGLWPQSLDDLIPYGPRQSVASLLRWLDRSGRLTDWMPLTAFAPFFRDVFNICRHEFIPEFLHDATLRTRFVDIICQQLNTATFAFINQLYSPSLALDRMQATVTVFNEVCVGVGSSVTAGIDIVDGLQARLLPALEIAFACADPLVVPKLTRSLLAAQLGVHHSMGSGHQVPQRLANVYTALQGSERGIHLDVYNRLKFLEMDVLCRAPDCRKHSRDTQAGKLQLCAGCRVLKYCSRECQKRHWSTQYSPHKPLCVRLKKLFAVAPLALKYPAFVAACRASPYAESFFKEIYHYLEEDVCFEITAEALAHAEALD